MNHRIIRLPEVIGKTGLARATLYRMATSGRFPASISLGGKAIGWVESEIDAWIERGMLARQTPGKQATGQ
ncbi:AlpA family transcriptional regulator [Massilia mucilaginosa]|uniref:AlpA family transcriptional regulator n=1 Tax=Massilia mucilaginosa TaxID=2609282 RepID=UPI0014204BEC|nr:AlpA family transcriptional regulator [Massilia mucilaginosa]